jgi:hypothetical protein
MPKQKRKFTILVDFQYRKPNEEDIYVKRAWYRLEAFSGIGAEEKVRRKIVRKHIGFERVLRSEVLFGWNRIYPTHNEELTC